MVSIKSFADINKTSVSEAGGKGASLGEMTQAGFLIPQGFVVLASTFDKFLEKTDLNVEIEAILSTVDHQAVHTVENASEKIQNLILTAKIPNDLESLILDNFSKLNSTFVAVRSSATSEDSADAAWAGQLDTFLNTTEDKLIENIKKCWASLFTPRAIFYRFEKGLHESHISVAVVVQKMVNSEKSGIAFSVHPVTEDPNQIIIEAGFGLGEAIVSGSVTPDSYVTDKRQHQILDINVNTQSKGLYRKQDGGNEWINLEEKGQEQVLSEAEILRISQEIIKIENHYGFPCDIEWAQENGEFYITQSRPITTLSPKKTNYQALFDEKAEIFRWGPVPAFYYYTSEYLDALSKHFSSLYQHDYYPTHLVMFEAKSMTWIMDFAEIRKFGLELFQKYMQDPISWKAIYQKWEDSIQEIEAVYPKISTEALSQLNEQELLDLMNEFYTKTIQFWLHTIPAEFGNYGADKYLEDELRKVISNQEELQDTLEILTSPEELSFFQEEEIRLSQTNDLKSHTENYFWLQNSYGHVKKLEEDFFRERKQNLKIELAQKAHHKINEVTLAKEEKRKKYQIPEDAMHVARTVSNNIIWQDKRKKHILINLYYKQIFLTELAKRYNVAAEELQRLSFKELSLNVAKEDFSLKRDKQFGFIIKKDLAEIKDPKYLKYLDSEYSNEKITDGTSDCQGIVVSKGEEKIIKGKVKIVLDPYKIEDFQTGDILIAPMTSPEYIFAMKKAKAIITDAGGLTSHAAIVSRELGIPCIVGTKIATQLFSDGMLIELNTKNGSIRAV